MPISYNNKPSIKLDLTRAEADMLIDAIEIALSRSPSRFVFGIFGEILRRIQDRLTEAVRTELRPG